MTIVYITAASHILIKDGRMVANCAVIAWTMTKKMIGCMTVTVDRKIVRLWKSRQVQKVRNDIDIKVMQEFWDAVHNGDEKKVYEIVKPGDYILLDNGHRYKFGGFWHPKEINRREHRPVNHCVVLPNGIIPWWDYKLYEHGTRGCLEMMFEANKQRIADRIKEK